MQTDLPKTAEDHEASIPLADRPPIRFGILGTGRITRRLVSDLQSTPLSLNPSPESVEASDPLPGVRVTAIASRTAERAKWYADAYGIAAAVEGYAALLARDDVDAVYIALPPSLHAEWMIAAAQAGKHVLCEKPMSTSDVDANAMADACRDARVHWLDATAWLHHERTDLFQRWLNESECPVGESTFRLGRLRHVSASVSFMNPFQSGDHRQDASLGGGCLLDLGWYAAGLLRFANNRLPTHVYADAIMRDGVPYRVTAMMKFPGDVSATMSCGFDTATRKWFEIAGEEASIVCDDFTRPWPDKPARGWVHEASGQVHPFSCECHQEHRMIGRLIEWIHLTRGGDAAWQMDSPPWQAYHDQALQTQSILRAVKQSMQTGQTVTL